MKKAIDRLSRMQNALAERHVPDLLAYGLALFSVILGLSLILDPNAFLEARSFRENFRLARPEAWGAGFAVSGILLALGFWRDGKSGQYAAIILTGLFCLFGFLASGGASNGGGVWSAPIVYTYVAYTGMICVITCGGKRGPECRTDR